MAPVVAGAKGQGLGFMQAVGVGSGELRLVVFGEKVDRTAVGTVVVELPGPFLEVFHGDARIILEDVTATAQDQGADFAEIDFVHEVGGRLHVGSERAETAHEGERSRLCVQAVVAEVGREVVDCFGLAVGATEFHFDAGNRFRVGGLGGVSGRILEMAGGIELHGADGCDLVASTGGKEHH